MEEHKVPMRFLFYAGNEAKFMLVQDLEGVKRQWRLLVPQ